MMNRELYITFKSLVVHRTLTVTWTNHKLLVAMSSIELGQIMKSFAVYSS